MLISRAEHRSLHAKRQHGRKVSLETKEKMRSSKLGKKASDYTKRKMSESYSRKVPVRCVELNQEFETIQAASLHFGIDRRSIFGCLKGTQKTAGGYHWEIITGKDEEDGCEIAKG